MSYMRDYNTKTSSNNYNVYKICYLYNLLCALRNKNVYTELVRQIFTTCIFQQYSNIPKNIHKSSKQLIASVVTNKLLSLSNMFTSLKQSII